MKGGGGAFVRKVGHIAAITKELLQGKMLCLVGGGLGGRKRNLCVRKPKVFHSALHLFKNTKLLNFRVHHNFRSEDYAGKVSQLAHTRVPAKLMDKYLILFH